MRQKSIQFTWRGLLIVGLILFVLFTRAGAGLAQGTQIRTMFVAQVLGNQSQKYVAGKDAAIMVLLTEAVPVNPATQSVVITRDGATVATLAPAPRAEPTALLVFACPDRATCGDWKAGAYTFEAKVGDSTLKSIPLNFLERRGLNVLGVPIKANYGPGDVRVPDERFKTLVDFTRQVYPVAPDKFKVTFAQEVDASTDLFNTKTAEGRLEMFKLVYALQPSKVCYEQPRPADANCYDSISGFVKSRMGPDANLQGFAISGTSTNINVESDDDAPATVAHEIGHLYALGDEYQGGSFKCDSNAPPAPYVGKDWNNRENATFSCTSSIAVLPPAGTGAGVILQADLPFEVGGRGLLPDMVNFMGSGAPQNRTWISAASWSWLFDQFDPLKKTSMLRPAPKLAAPRLATQERWIFASGTISKDDKIKVAPWYDFEDAHEHKDSTGKYTLRSVDAQGKVLASTMLNVLFTGYDQSETINSTLFEESVPFPENTAAFQILKDTKVLAEVKVSPNVPTIKITAPTAGQTLSGKVTIKWEASDKDNDKLFYLVEYSTDGEDWVVLAEDIDKPQSDEDFSLLPGSDKAVARIRVTVSDGINSAEATSELFKVPPKAPQVDIESPKANSTIPVGQDVLLKGGAYDLQDEEITADEALVWSSDLQGELGKGEMVDVSNLKPGKHTITLKATNSFKLTGSGTVVITIAAAGAAPASTAIPQLVLTPVGTRVAQAATPTPQSTLAATATRPAATTAPTSVATVAATIAPTRAATAVPTPPAPAAGDNTTLIISVIIALVVIGGIGWYMMQRRKGTST